MRRGKMLRAAQGLSGRAKHLNSLDSNPGAPTVLSLGLSQTFLELGAMSCCSRSHRTSQDWPQTFLCRLWAFSGCWSSKEQPGTLCLSLPGGGFMGLVGK